MGKFFVILLLIYLMSASVLAQEIKVPDVSADEWNITGAQRVEFKVPLSKGKDWTTSLSIYPVAAYFVGENNTWARVVSCK